MGGKRSARLVPLLVPFAISAAAPAVAEDQTPPSAPASSPAPVVIVLDGSKDMWSKIGGQGKVPLVRTAIGAALGDYKDKLAFGLVAFGHGAASGCNDVEVRAKPGELTQANRNKVLLNFNPRNSRPLAAALTEGAKLAPPRGRLDLILITDGSDNCKMDTCATAKALKQAVPGLRMHVLGFDPTPSKDLKAMACVAEASGGRFSTVANAAELKEELTAALDIAAMPLPVRAPEPAATAAATPAVAPAAQVTPPADAAATATATAVAPAAPSPEAETVPPAPAAQPDPAPAPDSVQAVPPAQADAKMGPPAPGETAVQKSIGPSAPQTPRGATGLSQSAAKAPSSAPSVPVPVTFRALLTEAGPKVESGVTWRIFTARPGPDGKRKLVSTHREAVPTEALLPGDYLVNAAYGLSNLTKEIKVESGRSLEETFILNCGGLKLDAMLTTGQPLPAQSVKFDILSDEEDQFGNRREILGDAKPGVVIRLNAGAYHIVSTYGHTNATVRADVTVEPGKITQATIKHAAAPVTFKLVQSAGGEALADTKWTILTNTGDVVKETAGALPTHILAAGDYAAVANHNGASYTAKFNVTAGQPKQIEVVMERGPTSPEELQAIRNPPPPPEPAEPGTGAPDTGMAFGSDGATPPTAPGGLINPGVLLRPRLP